MRNFTLQRTAVAVAIVLLCSFCAHASVDEAPRWIASWGASQMRATSDACSPAELRGATLRQVVRISIGGDALRLHLSNAFGDQPLVIAKVEVAKRSPGAKGTIDPTSRIAVQFGGRPSVSIPMGVEYFSDPIPLRVTPLSDLVVTMYIDEVPTVITSHPGARATSYLLRGEHVSDTGLEGATELTQWYFLAGVQVWGGSNRGTIVALGDSITDGHGAGTDRNQRWTDTLAERIAGTGWGVVNEGIGGNRILADGLGPNALSRLDRDVIAVAGARAMVFLEGVNDLGALDRTQKHPAVEHENMVAALENAMRQVVARAHAHGIRVYGGTVMPFMESDYYHPDSQTEDDRQELNQWIRASGTFDGVIDFDSLMRDPVHPSDLAPGFDSGDHLHPNPAGYKRMGEAIPLQLLQ